MPLFVGGKLIQKSKTLLKDILNEKTIKSFNKQLKESQLQVIKKQKKVLYVHQREFATCLPKNVEILGSGNATTCNILVLRSQETGKSSCAHFDGAENQVYEEICSLNSMVETFDNQEQEKGIDVHLVGGFKDEKHDSDKISLEILTNLSEQKGNFHLLTACVSEENNQIIKDNINAPVIRGIAINPKDGTIFNAKFLERGPKFALRSARSLTGKLSLLQIYDFEKNQYVLGPFDYRNFPHAQYLLECNDQFLLENLSTSPKVEEDNFVTDLKETLNFLKKYPDSQMYFQGQPKIIKFE